jgi:hypothetical protein
MHDFQNALYINPIDPSNAVIYDRGWLRREAADSGLTIVSVQPPAVRGYQWILVMALAEDARAEAPFPVDDAPIGRRPPPLLRPGAGELGLRPARER